MHGRTEEAIAQYDALVKLNPSPINRLLAASVLPVVYDSKSDVAAWRQRLTNSLDAVISDGGTVDATESLVPTSFFLAYQGLNDADVMRRLGRICRGTELVPRHTMLQDSGGQGWTEGSPEVLGMQPPTLATQHQSHSLKPRSDGRLRIGFLSAYFRDHTIGRLELGSR